MPEIYISNICDVKGTENILDTIASPRPDSFEKIFANEMFLATKYDVKVSVCLIIYNELYGLTIVLLFSKSSGRPTLKDYTAKRKCSRYDEHPP